MTEAWRQELSGIGVSASPEECDSHHHPQRVKAIHLGIASHLTSHLRCCVCQVSLALETVRLYSRRNSIQEIKATTVAFKIGQCTVPLLQNLLLFLGLFVTKNTLPRACGNILPRKLQPQLYAFPGESLRE